MKVDREALADLDKAVKCAKARNHGPVRYARGISIKAEGGKVSVELTYEACTAESYFAWTKACAERAIGCTLTIAVRPHPRMTFTPR